MDKHHAGLIRQWVNNSICNKNFKIDSQFFTFSPLICWIKKHLWQYEALKIFARSVFECKIVTKKRKQAKFTLKFLWRAEDAAGLLAGLAQFRPTLTFCGVLFIHPFGKLTSRKVTEEVESPVECRTYQRSAAASFCVGFGKRDDVTASICACPETTGPCGFEVPAASLRLLAACLSGRCCFGRAEKGEIYTGEESVHMRQPPQTLRPSDPPRTIPLFFPAQLKIWH